MIKKTRFKTIPKIISHLGAKYYLLITISFMTVLFSITHPGMAVAHLGGQDQQGGHFNSKTNTYHCHSQSCFQQHQLSQQALDIAQQEKRTYSTLYSREDWPHWSDLDNDCQDTRAEILIASSKVKVSHSAGNRCYKVRHGEWHDVYTNKTFYNAWELDIDHRIALAEANRYGGAGWSKAQKEAFANDPLNLVAVQGEANKAKSSHPAYEWMPKDLSYWCEYIKARERVVEKYALTFPAKEQQFNEKIKKEFCR